MFCIKSEPLASCCLLSSTARFKKTASFFHLMTGAPRSDSAPQFNSTLLPRMVTASDGSVTNLNDVKGLIWEPKRAKTEGGVNTGYSLVHKGRKMVSSQICFGTKIPLSLQTQHGWINRSFT